MVKPPEPRWHASIVVLLTILLYVTLPSKLTLGPVWAFPLVVLVLLVPLSIFAPYRRVESPLQHGTSIVLIAIVNLFNVASVIELIFDLVFRGGKGALSGQHLLLAGGQIWLTNILVFSLWYWELDGGGPQVRDGARSENELAKADFLFTAMLADYRKSALIDPAWKPMLLDYLYLAFTNALAFSPTDTFPMTGMAKVLMMAEAVISFVTMAVVVSRAVNIIS
ncbi:MAG: hypothetical protein ACYDG3_08495 [Bacillati bacterium]